MGVGSAVVGAAAGSAIGAAAGNAGAGAAIGGAASLAGGVAIGANDAAATEGDRQTRYDIAYAQCMYTPGDTVQSTPHGGYGYYANVGYPYYGYPYYGYPWYDWAVPGFLKVASSCLTGDTFSITGSTGSMTDSTVASVRFSRWLPWRRRVPPLRLTGGADRRPSSPHECDRYWPRSRGCSPPEAFSRLAQASFARPGTLG